MKHKIKDSIKKIPSAFHKDISYNYGGWLFFSVRLFWNAVILYYLMNFLKIFILFSFTANGIISPEYLEIVEVSLWAIGIIYLIIRMGSWKVVKEE